MKYDTFLKSKSLSLPGRGFKPSEINQRLFGWQQAIVDLACRRGSFGGFQDCGLGKTAQQLECAAQFVKATNKKMLLLCPLAVSYQTLREADKFEIDVEMNVCKSQDDVRSPISITNYERLHKFDPTAFDGIVLDEGSILKSVDGKYRNAILSCFQHCSFKQSWTATPAPNDYMEIGNQSEFVGAMNRSEMLSTFFVHDGGDTSQWRLKGHAKQEFWTWLASWAVCLRTPGDIGYAEDGYELPDLIVEDHEVGGGIDTGMLFDMPASTLAERRQAKRQTLNQRCEHVAELVSNSEERWVIWCNLNKEAEKVTELIPDAVEVAGRHSVDIKEDRLSAFTNGDIRVLITKPKIGGFGLNWQHCHNTVIFPTDSWEQWYQMIRRFWRFGQKDAVNVHVVFSTGEAAVVSNLQKKERESHEMFESMSRHMADITRSEIRGVSCEKTNYLPKVAMRIPGWLQNASTKCGEKTGRCTKVTAAR